ncbi:MAG: hypothetical protein V2I67_08765 [Thermoanaerobaculales bacterium]|nr:hypothetical protein [Thermoanaerobaculales bacterium]
MRRTTMMVLVGLLVAPVLVLADGGGFDEELFEIFLEARVGTGEPVYWYSIGEVWSYPDGKLLAMMEGIDTARLVRDETDPHTAYQLSRKTFVYRDPETNEIFREVDGKEASHIKYPYQYITYTLDGDLLLTSVEQGSGARLRTMGPMKTMVAQRLGDVAQFSAPLFLNFETPRGKYEAFEHYDFFIQPDGSMPNQLSWLRYGDLPPFLGPGRTVIHLVGWRVDNFDALPDTIKEWIETDAKLWREPPEDMDEIRELQQPKDVPSN